MSVFRLRAYCYLANHSTTEDGADPFAFKQWLDALQRRILNGWQPNLRQSRSQWTVNMLQYLSMERQGRMLDGMNGLKIDDGPLRLNQGSLRRGRFHSSLPYGGVNSQ